jgi:hypothetical protein
LVEGLKAIFRPSTWQVACVVIADKLVVLVVASLGEPRRLAMMMVLAISDYNYNAQLNE